MVRDSRSSLVAYYYHVLFPVDIQSLLLEPYSYLDDEFVRHHLQVDVDVYFLKFGFSLCLSVDDHYCLLYLIFLMCGNFQYRHDDC